jgi:predicted HTH transcriptional regulator
LETKCSPVPPWFQRALATLMMMEQRGTGFARMRDAMLNHGLEEPAIAQQDGFFVVTLPGPAGNFDRIRVPENVGGLVTPAVEAQLNERQRTIVACVLEKGSVTSGWCRKQFGITYDTANRDLRALMDFGILERKSSGPGTRYEIGPQIPPAS